MDRRLWLPLIALAVMYVGSVCAGFLAPYPYEVQNRGFAYAPPTRLHWSDPAGHLRLRPFVYGIADDPGHFGEYIEDHGRVYPVRLFVEGTPYKVAGLGPFHVHLFGVDEPARVFLIGSDAFGRDQFSRLLYGSQISLFAGLFAMLLSLGIGVPLGTIAGFYGKWTDEAVIRVTELFLALPWLCLLLAIRAFLPLQIEPATAFLVCVGVIGAVGWARPARLVRGIALSARERNYVLAGRNLGASDLYLLRRHILPETYSVALTQAALLAPQYILAEVVLSFLGLGVGEPVPSWGNILAALQHYNVLVSYWWMLLPAFAFLPVFGAYYALATALEKRVQS